MHHPSVVTPILLIGAQKSGSSYLFRLLAQDPTIALARLKEPKIFSKPMHDDDDFLSHFQIGPEHRFVLDSSVSYMHVAGTATQVAARLGTDMPVIAVLRDPVERAVSGYLHEVKHGRDLRPPDMVFDLPCDLDAAVVVEDAAIEVAWKRGDLQPHNSPEARYRDPFFQFRHVANSCYALQLAHWQRVFPNLKLVDFSDLRSDPAGVAARLRSWLGLEGADRIETTLPHNATRLSNWMALRSNRVLLHDHDRPGLLSVWARQRALFRRLRADKPDLPPALAKTLRSAYASLQQKEAALWI